jgi:hypothetical protein
MSFSATRVMRRAPFASDVNLHSNLDGVMLSSIRLRLHAEHDRSQVVSGPLGGNRKRWLGRA